MPNALRPGAYRCPALAAIIASCGTLLTAWSAGELAASQAPRPAAQQGVPKGPGSTGPEAKVNGYRVAVERVQENENFWLEFDGGPAKVAGRNTLSLFLAVRPPRREMAANIEGLDSRFVAFTETNRPVTFQPYMPDDADPLVTGVWRTCLVASDLDTTVASLKRIQGELLVYPKAKIVTTDFPLNGKYPQSTVGDGLKVTLKQVTLRPSVLTAIMAVEWTGPASLARVSSDAMYGITGISRADTTQLPNGGGSSSSSTRGAVTTREYKVTFLDMREVPAKLRFSNVFRSGAVQKLAFNLGDLALPDTVPAGTGGPGNASLDGPLQPIHPMHSAVGATLVLAGGAGMEVGSGPEDGPLPVGLSRREGNEWGPWRWIDVPPDKGVLRIRRVLPGKYRVVVATGGGPQEVDLVAGRETRLSFTRAERP